MTQTTWTVPEKKIKDYQPTTAKAELVQFDTSQLSKNQVSLYWVDGDQKIVSLLVDAVIGGNQVTLNATATFNVRRPQITFTGKYGPTISFTSPPNATGISFFCKMDISKPSSPESGSLCWVQTGRSISHLQNANGEITTIDQSGCDGTFPYDKFENGGPVDYPGLANFPNPPWVKLDSAMSFTTWLLFKPSPPHSIWVPLAKGDWSWNGIVEVQQDNWILSSRSPTDENVLNGTNTTEIVQWWTTMHQTDVQ